MKPLTNSETEEGGSTPIELSQAPPETKESMRSFLAQARRSLSEEELATPAARRFLIPEIERLDERCLSLDAIVVRLS